MTPKTAGEASLTLADFDYDLPEARIALHPVSPRDSSKLLVVGQGGFDDRVFRDLPDLLNAGDLLVFNDTKVIPARLLGRRYGQSIVVIEALLLKRVDERTWEAFAKPGKRLKKGYRVEFGHGADYPDDNCGLAATVVDKDQTGRVWFQFDSAGPELDAAIAKFGRIPLPPYIIDARLRANDENWDSDRNDYQTVFAKNEGAVASPTASLHFTPGLIERLSAKGIGHAFLTLHVGAGTFLPVKAENIADHRMHAEWGEIRAETAHRINETRAKGGRIIAVGTTVCRLLESAVDAHGQIQPFLGDTDIFLRPGHVFRGMDALITNFHLPKSTLLMLVSAFAGTETMRRAYQHAIENGYRFYSYGDSSLLWPGCA